jgi:hypothetical protein
MSNVNGETLKASESGLVSKVRQRQRSYGRGAIETVRLIRIAAGLPVPTEPMAAIWRNPEFRTPGETMDAAVKGVSGGLYDVRYGREYVGMSQTEIAQIEERENTADPVVGQIARVFQAGVTGGRRRRRLLTCTGRCSDIRSCSSRWAVAVAADAAGQLRRLVARIAPQMVAFTAGAQLAAAQAASVYVPTVLASRASTLTLRLRCGRRRSRGGLRRAPAGHVCLRAVRIAKGHVARAAATAATRCCRSALARGALQTIVTDAARDMTAAEIAVARR